MLIVDPLCTYTKNYIVIADAWKMGTDSVVV